MPLCSLCRKPATPRYAPFCSDRCQKLDLHRWLAGGYAVAAEATPDDEPNLDGEEET